jgi:lipopolysaccharide/colanic/teichoic acid biosynthesis glycosyltransferase
MLREKQYILRQVTIALDAFMTLLALALAYAARQAIQAAWPDALAVMWFRAHVWLIPVAPLVTLAALALNGLYDAERLRTGMGDLTRRIGLSCLEALLALMSIVLLFGETDRTPATMPGTNLGTDIGQTSRVYLLLVGVATFALLAVKTRLLRAALLRMRRRARNLRRVLLVGSGEPLARIARTIEHHPIWGFEIEGVVSDRPEDQGRAFGEAGRSDRSDGSDRSDADGDLKSSIVNRQSSITQHPTPGTQDPIQLRVLADLDGGPALLARAAVDEVIFVPDAVPISRLQALMEACEEIGVRMHFPLSFYRGPIARPVLGRLDDLPVLSYWPTRDIGPALLFKYAFDRLAAPALLILLSPVMLAVALAIRLASKPGEPVLFGQTRCGLNGRRFTCWKFRSMAADAQARRAELDALNEQAGPVFKMEHDPRVTPLGRWLRRFSLDELPQLWNVARGEMSLVGPRPPLPEEVERYDRWQRRRLSMKPGITCLWQVRGRNRLPFETWMKLDLEYIDRWSPWLDLKILLRTAWVVATGYGAM